MVNEKVLVKTTSGDITGILIAVKDDYIVVGNTVLIPLNRIVDVRKL